jgi:ribonuclease P protein component
MNIKRLLGRKHILGLRRKGKVFKTKTMVFVYMLGPPPLKEEATNAWYIGTAASTKLHKLAVKRNRMRRRCREAVRTTILPEQNLPTLQLLISPKSASLDAPYAQLKTDVEQFLTLLRNQ